MDLPLFQRALATEVGLHDSQALDDHGQVEGVVTVAHVDLPIRRWSTGDEKAQLCVLGLEVGDTSAEAVELSPEIGVLIAQYALHDAGTVDRTEVVWEHLVECKSELYMKIGLVEEKRGRGLGVETPWEKSLIY